jgi:ligand-binding SRPBCC domain-containing protein
MKILFETNINAPLEFVKNGFNKELFDYLAPFFIGTTVVRFDGCHTSDEVHLEMGPLKQKWVSVITHFEEDDQHWCFIDEGSILPWPLGRWKHTHLLKRVNNETLIIDDIVYECHHPLLNYLMYPFLWAVFAIRPRRYKKYFKVKSK